MIKLDCIIGGHRWSSGRCRRCGAVHRKHQWWNGSCRICHLNHENHAWVPAPGKCQERCLCGLTRSTHKWNGCKCTVCGEVRGEGHQWVRKEGVCLHTCTVCGQRQGVPHRYQPIPGQCREKCAWCGMERRMEHVIVNGTCTRCSMPANEAYLELALEEGGQTASLNYAQKITDPELLKKFILTKDDHYVCLYSINYLSDDQVLASIALDNAQDYEVRIKARSKIKDEALRKSIKIEEDPGYRAMYDMDIKSGM